MATYSQQLQRVFAKFETTVSDNPSSLHDVCEWGFANGYLKPRPADVISQFAKDMAEALRQEYRTDRKGRRYRTKHAVRMTKNGHQTSLWADLDKAPYSHMQKAFSQRRRQIVGDCHQLRLDVDHYNDTSLSDKPIQLVLDFTDDVEELLMLEGIEEAA